MGRFVEFSDAPPLQGCVQHPGPARLLKQSGQAGEFPAPHIADRVLILRYPASAAAIQHQEARGDRHTEDEESVGSRHGPVETDPHERHYDVHVRKQSTDIQYHDGSYAV